MKNKLVTISTIIFISTLLLTACSDPSQNLKQAPNTGISKDGLPAPYSTKSKINFSKVIGWPAGKTPVAPAGFVVTKFADNLHHPRWIYEAANGDVFVAESNTKLSGLKRIGAKLSRKISTQGYGVSADRITMFRDGNDDGIPESRFVFAENLNQPLGMLIINHHFYVANTNGLMQFDYIPGSTRLGGEGKQIVSLPAGGYNNHWTRNIIAGKKGDKIYISVGSGTNIAEHGMANEIRRANILEINIDGTGERVYASGLRNPVGMDWAPGTETLWTAVNERDGLGDNLVPDYLTSVKDSGFYGWPWSYFGEHKDPRMKKKQQPEMVKKAIVPDVDLGAHTASLGLAFYNKKAFPSQYHNGAFIGQHGSWNRSQLAGYKVVFVPFSKGKPSGKPVDFLTGFIADTAKSEVYGRPVGVTILTDGSMLVADDVSGIVWKISSKS